ncbi:hypothetical protein PCANC_10514 [Puccinia coronata f. sp. avenae]|uniref:Uncharacterized protein n=1 Tax=Puccinia coronata f. sp. avenae TaxID=200324 RepID=A0A2N5VZ50_9BASI|nr:hypothetical protein PCANC_10514 [Puccinia coronata f. sp. avenae]
MMITSNFTSKVKLVTLRARGLVQRAPKCCPGDPADKGRPNRRHHVIVVRCSLETVQPYSERMRRMAAGKTTGHPQSQETLAEPISSIQTRRKKPQRLPAAEKNPSVFQPPKKLPAS